MTDEDFKRTLWDAANGLRGAVSAAEYKYPVLGLVFLKYVSDMFDAQADVIRKRLANPESDLFIEDAEIRAESEEDFVDDRTFYETDNVFWIPREAKFAAMVDSATAPDLAQKLDKAMQLIEAENSQLKGVLYREFSRLALEPGKLGELVNTIARMRFNPKDHGSRDIFGEVYEYFLGQFAMSEGQRAGEFYTPKSVVNLLVEILAPFKGKIYDPACGSGGMFVQSMKFKDAHQKTLGRKGDLAIYGQELMAHTRKLCLMNLAVHGLDGDLGKSYGSTFTNDQHKSLRADYILANPPFNISKWDGDKLTEDPRWVFDIPPAGNANYAWLQHMWNRLSSKGRAGIVLANGSMSSNTSNEGVIRKNMIKGNAVECMVALPAQLFSNTQIPACLWFLSRDKSAGTNGRSDRTNQVLFIDARKIASGRLSRTQIEFTETELHKLSQIYHRWRGTEFADDADYEDVPGLCYSATIDDIESHNFNLSPGRYVGAADVEDDEAEYEEEMATLTAELSEQIKTSTELDDKIRKALMGVGYEV
ncbi:class I SAM-dependent DNA methyltransferase [uncultured Alteromonas sp.]|uniref:type I restriction-modification system subunit M n=1 Tax=uncultured Alteromonas sp. TaxID=179113 RepID=UPI0030DBA57D